MVNNKKKWLKKLLTNKWKSDKISFVVKQTWKNNLKKLLTRKKFDDKLRKSLEGDKVKLVFENWTE